MKQLTIKCVDAFTNRSFAGNPAGVIADAGGLTRETMQHVASQMFMNIIEYGFVVPAHTKPAAYGVKYFTPKQELGCSGHVTIATCFSLVEDGKIALADGTTKVVFETGMGNMQVDVYRRKGEAHSGGRDGGDGGFQKDPAGGGVQGLEKIMMHQPVQDFRESDVPAEDIATVLGIERNEITQSGLPIVVATADVEWLIVPVKRKETILDMRPDLIKLGKLNREYGIHTNHIFTTDTFDPDCITYARHFGPVMGLWEDPATAMAAGGLGVYLNKYGMTSSKSMTMEQGSDPGRLAQLLVEFDYRGAQISTVRVGGLAATSIVKRVRLESGKAIVIDEAPCPV